MQNTLWRIWQKLSEKFWWSVPTQIITVATKDEVEWLIKPPVWPIETIAPPPINNVLAPQVPHVNRIIQFWKKISNPEFSPFPHNWAVFVVHDNMIEKKGVRVGSMEELKLELRQASITITAYHVKEDDIHHCVSSMAVLQD